MPHSLFISDLHLSHGHPHTTELFLRFAADVAPKAEALYILGDLFEYWAGDDDLDDPFHQRITNALRTFGQVSHAQSPARYHLNQTIKGDV